MSWFRIPFSTSELYRLVGAAHTSDPEAYWWRYAVISADMLGRSSARNKGTCDNRASIRRDELEGRVLTALHSHLMDPALFAAFCDDFTRELTRISMEGGAAIAAAHAEVDKLERDIAAPPGQ